MRVWIPLAVMCLVFSLAPRADACGGMLFKDHEHRPGGMSDQQVLITQSGANTMVVVSVAYVGAKGDFAFLFPLQKPTSKVADGDASLFGQLEQETAPRVIVEDATLPPPPTSSGCSCAGMSGDKSALPDYAGSAAPSVVIHDRGQTQTYEYVVIGGDDAQTVSTWLEQEGFKAPAEFQAALDGYLAKGWLFLAAKLLASAPEGNLAPLVLSFTDLPTEALAYPFGMSAQSMAPGSRMSVTLYLAGPTPLLPVDYAVAPIATTRLAATSPVDSNYDDVFEEQTQAGGMVLEYGAVGRNPFSFMEGDTAKAVSSMVGSTGSLVRLRAKLGAQQLKDSGFRKAKSEEATQSNVHRVVWSGKEAAVAPEKSPSMVWGWLLIAAGAIARRRRVG